MNRQVKMVMHTKKINQNIILEPVNPVNPVKPVNPV